MSTKYWVRLRSHLRRVQLNILEWNYRDVQLKLPDQRVHFLGLDVIHLFHSILDLFLISANVHNENQSIVVLNLFHCRLSSQRVFKNLILVQLIPWSNTNAWILGISVLLQCLWSVKCDGCPDFLGFLLKCWARFYCLGSFQGLSLRVSLLGAVSWGEEKYQAWLVYSLKTNTLSKYFVCSSVLNSFLDAYNKENHYQMEPRIERLIIIIIMSNASIYM